MVCRRNQLIKHRTLYQRLLTLSRSPKTLSGFFKVRQELEERGATVLTGLHALGDDVNIAFAPNEQATAFNAVVAQTLRRFSQGMKVAVEITLMAADAGLLDTTHEVIAIGGTDEGADTAIVIKPAYARKFKNIKIREIIAKPR